MSDRDADVRDLLGAYALDALDAPERRRVDALLAVDAGARREVDALVETAGLLALAPLAPRVPDAPPAAVWDRIVEQVGLVPTAGDGEGAEPDAVVVDASGTAAPDDELARRRARRSVPLRVVLSLATAAAALVVALGIQVVDRRAELRELRGEPDPVAATADVALASPDVRTLDLAVDTGVGPAGRDVRVAYLPDGTGFLLGEGLSALDADRTYQLWALVGDPGAPVAISAGVLGSAPDVAAFRVSGPVVGFALTIEAAGGVASSEQPPFAVATFES